MVQRSSQHAQIRHVPVSARAGESALVEVVVETTALPGGKPTRRFQTFRERHDIPTYHTWFPAVFVVSGTEWC